MSDGIIVNPKQLGILREFLRSKVFSAMIQEPDSPSLPSELIKLRVLESTLQHASDTARMFGLSDVSIGIGTLNQIKFFSDRVHVDLPDLSMQEELLDIPPPPPPANITGVDNKNPTFGGYQPLKHKGGKGKPPQQE